MREIKQKAIAFTVLTFINMAIQAITFYQASQVRAGRILKEWCSAQRIKNNYDCRWQSYLDLLALARGSATLNASFSRILWLLSCRDKKVTPPSGEGQNIHSTYDKYVSLSKTNIYIINQMDMTFPCRVLLRQGVIQRRSVSRVLF